MKLRICNILAFVHSFQQLSQFWYNTDTKVKLAQAVRHFKDASEGKELRVALLSSPSLYHHVKEVIENGKSVYTIHIL